MRESYLDLKGNRLILASKSPRRHELMKGLGIPFEVRTKEVDESFDPSLSGAEIPVYLAEKKAEAFLPELASDEILVTSDTVVWLGDRVFNKPENRHEAIEMISTLSGRSHEVITAVCLASKKKRLVESETTTVHFGELDAEAVAWYVDRYRPFDKAGAYGIQEWIGYVGIERIEGSFYNVMGFPTRLFYLELEKFLRS
jgi:septum formation protein